MNNFAIHIPASDLRTFVARALIALCLGALVGAERQWRQRNAGLRTNALVALGACLFELLSVLMLTGHSADPSRIAAYVIAGIGFLGAGVIFRGGSTVTGINTAATIWCSAAVGLLSGAGYPYEAMVAAGLIVFLHLVLRPVARRIDRMPATGDSEVETVYQFRAVCKSSNEAHIRALVVQALSRGELDLRAVASEDIGDEGSSVEVVVELSREGRDDVALEQAVSRLSLEPSVTSVRWEVIEGPVLELSAERPVARATWWDQVHAGQRRPPGS
jgi:putative Mg2+ transporter-C (MgtC) family protein